MIKQSSTEERLATLGKADILKVLELPDGWHIQEITFDRYSDDATLKISLRRYIS